MKAAISEVKKSILLELIGKMDEKISNLYHQLEEDQTITLKTFRESEQEIDIVLSVLREIHDEVYFS